ncbi:hypothetical protein [Methylotetracoccus oryzae]|uniref:hypothetical protein n=1 Tax=Methylotetracoccus oryzae TaxID=1919059 RepID=UPI00111862DE|nr:hypothetical protein [Methylotetracoccus oryzae]
MKAISLIAGAVLMSGAGLASAGEALTAAQMDGVTGGGCSYCGISLNLNKNITGTIKETSLVTSAALILGNTAVAAGSADAYGNNTFTEVQTATLTTDYSSSSAGASVSATGY